LVWWQTCSTGWREEGRCSIGFEEVAIEANANLENEDMETIPPQIKPNHQPQLLDPPNQSTKEASKKLAASSD
jgi:hypothetical protein